MNETPLLQVDDLRVQFGVRDNRLFGRTKLVRAVDGVSLTLDRGQTLGVVGESGSGKTTLGRAILRRLPISAGRIRFRGEDITEARGARLRALTRHMQLVFQDPVTSLNPRMTVFDIIAEPLLVHGLGRDRAALARRVDHLISLVGLPDDSARRYPHAFSGGQRQRIGIARALALEPDLVVADEPVSSLDVSVRAQVINLMQDLQDRLGLAYILIAHDLAVVRHAAHRVVILYNGVVVESGTRDVIYDTPRHPYTEALLASVPVPDPTIARARRGRAVTGEPPSPISPPTGCRFHPRCPVATGRCQIEAPSLEEKSPGHYAACWLR